MKAKALAPTLRSAVCGRRMPPWPPSNQCNTYAHDRSLTDAQIVTLRDWIDSGADIAGAVAHAPVAPGGLSRVDRELPLPEPYLPTIAPDDYRCFLIDWPDTEERFITGFGVEPDQAAEVHHVILFRIAPETTAPLLQADVDDPLPGYSCFGGPNPSTSKKITTLGVPSMVGPGRAGRRLSRGPRRAHAGSLQPRRGPADGGPLEGAAEGRRHRRARGLPHSLRRPELWCAARR